jgi:hypothetical protein
MIFSEPLEYAMVVMDGRRCIAKARRKGTGQWLLSLEGASWADTMINEKQKAWLKKLGLRPNASPWLKVVETKAQARRELQLLAGVI